MVGHIPTWASAVVLSLRCLVNEIPATRCTAKAVFLHALRHFGPVACTASFHPLASGPTNLAFAQRVSVETQGLLRQRERESGREERENMIVYWSKNLGNCSRQNPSSLSYHKLCFV